MGIINWTISSLPGRPVEVDLDRVKQLIEDDPRLTTCCLAEQLGCSHYTMETLGTTWKYGLWISQQLSAYILQHRVDVYMGLLTSHRNYEWPRNLVTGDEKWLLYINYARKRQWLSVHQTGTVTPKNDLHPKKVMLSVWWAVQAIIY